MRSPSLILGSFVLALSFQPLLAQKLENQSSKLALAQASGFDFAKLSQASQQKATGAARYWTGSDALIPKVLPTPLVFNKDLCYTMRVYHFKREGTDAPQMTGSTTCTPNRSILRQAERRGRYVPQ